MKPCGETLRRMTDETCNHRWTAADCAGHCGVCCGRRELHANQEGRADRAGGDQSPVEDDVSDLARAERTGAGGRNWVGGCGSDELNRRCIHPECLKYILWRYSMWGASDKGCTLDYGFSWRIHTAGSG